MTRQLIAEQTQLTRIVISSLICLGIFSTVLCQAEETAKSTQASTANSVPSAEILSSFNEATHLVVIDNQVSGTAWSFHPDGWLMTSFQAVTEVELGSPVNLISPVHKGLTGRVVRKDEKSQLALIQLNKIDEKGPQRFPAIKMTGDPLPQAHTSLMVLGYSVSGEASDKQPSFDSKNIRIDKVEVLDGRIDLPSAVPLLRKFDTGAPLVDSAGNLLGLVAFPPGFSTNSQLITIREILSFLSLRSVIISPSRIEFDQTRSPVVFNFELIEIEKSPALWHIDFSLRTPNGRGTGNGVNPQEKGWQINVVPDATPPVESTRLRLTVPCGMRKLQGEMDDRTIRIGEDEIALRKLRRVEKLPDIHKAICIDGTELQGKITGLESLSALTGAPFDPLLADSIDFQVAEPLYREYAYELEFEFDSVPEFRQKGVIPVEHAPLSIINPLHDSRDPVAAPLGYTVIEAYIEGNAEFVLNQEALKVVHKSGAELPGQPTDHWSQTAINLNEYPWIIDWLRPLRNDQEVKESPSLPLKSGTLDWDVNVLSIRNGKVGPPEFDRGTVTSRKRPDQLNIQIEDTKPGGGWYRIAISRPISAPSRVWEPLPGVWDFNETGGPAVLDQRHYWPGEIVPDMLPEKRVQDSKRGNVLRLDGKTVVDCGNAADVDSSDRFSIGGWFLPDSGSDMTCVSKMDNEAKRGWELGYSNGKGIMRLVHESRDNSFNGIEVETKRPLLDGQWHSMVVTYDGSRSAKGVNLFIDGKLEPLEIVHDTLEGTIRTAAPFQIGGRFQKPDYIGMLDEIHFDNTQLNSREITTRFSNSTGPQVTTTTRPMKRTAPTTPEIPAGIWKVKYSNTSEREYHFLGKDQVELSGTRGKLRIQNQDVLLEFGDGKLERLNFDGQRIFVEHFPVATEYPNSIAGILGIGVYQGDLPEVEPDPDRVAKLKGIWRVAYTSSAVRHYQFDDAGKVHVSGMKGKAYIQNKDLLFDVNDGKLERATLFGNRLFIEHYNPSSTYPAEFPAALGIGQRR